MALFVEDLFEKSSRRRCVKGRSSYIEPSDSLVPPEDKVVEGNFNYSEDNDEQDNSENVEVEDLDEVTIDLSDFLNVNPLLPVTSSENTLDSGALSDCHSQFRVTTSRIDSSQIEQKDLPPQNETVITDNTPADVSFQDSQPVVPENGIAVCSENSFGEVSSENVSCKENIVNGIKHSPDKFLSAKLKRRPPKNFKSLSRLKDFNKNNIRVFGKYPVVQCEKLDIDNFVKMNKIKVGNWPLLPAASRKLKPYTIKNIAVNKKNSPHIIRHIPKPFGKQISFNKFGSNHTNGSLERARSILVESLESKGDLSKDSFSNRHPSLHQNIIKTNFANGEPLFKLMPHKTNSYLNNHLKMQKFPIITSVNKMVGSPKTFQLISPKTISPNFEKNSVTRILPKPAIDTSISPGLLNDFTVIQPYVEDPTSPIKPKSILTVPLDIVPTIETVNSQIIIDTPIKSRSKTPKTKRSVFLDRAIQQISFPKKVGNKFASKNIKTAEDGFEKVVKSPVSATSVVVDAMQSVFDKVLTKKVKAKPLSKTNSSNSVVGFTGLGCNAYNSTLNDMIFGFEDFDSASFDVNNSEDTPPEACDSNNSIVNLDTQKVFPDKQKIQSENESEKDINNDRLSIEHKVKKGKKSALLLHDSDTWSASEGEESDPAKVRMSYVERRRKKSSNSPIKCKKRRSSSSYFRRNSTYNQDSDSSDKTLSVSNKRKSMEKLKESKDRHSEDSSLFLEKNSEESENGNEKPNLDTQAMSPDPNTEVLSDNYSDVQSSEIKCDETFPKGRNRAKLRNRLNQKSSKKQHFKISKQNSKQTSIVHGKSNRNRLQPRYKGKLSAISKKPLSRPADIIKEINTITGANLTLSKKKKGKSVTAQENDMDNTEAIDDKQVKTPKPRKGQHSKTKKSKTLQVLFKRPTRKPSSRTLSTREDTNSLSDNIDESSLGLDNSFDSAKEDESLKNSEIPNIEDVKLHTEAISVEPNSKSVADNNVCQQNQFTSRENVSIDEVMDSQTTTNCNSAGLKYSSENIHLNQNVELNVSRASDDLHTNDNVALSPLDKTNSSAVSINYSNVEHLPDGVGTENKFESSDSTKTSLSGSVVSTEDVSKNFKSSENKETEENSDNERIRNELPNDKISPECKAALAVVLDFKEETNRSQMNLKFNPDCDSNAVSTLVDIQAPETDETKKLSRPKRKSHETSSDLDETKKLDLSENNLNSLDEVNGSDNIIVAVSTDSSSAPATITAEGKRAGRPKKNKKSNAAIQNNIVHSDSASMSLECSSTLENNITPETIYTSTPAEVKKFGRPKRNLKSNALNDDSIVSLNASFPVECSSTQKNHVTPDRVSTSKPDKVEKLTKPKKNIKFTALNDTSIENVESTILVDSSSALKNSETPDTVPTLTPGKVKKLGRPKKKLKSNALLNNSMENVNISVIGECLSTKKTHAIPDTASTSKPDKVENIVRSENNTKFNALPENSLSGEYSPSEIAPQTVCSLKPSEVKKVGRPKRNFKFNALSENNNIAISKSDEHTSASDTNVIQENIHASIPDVKKRAGRPKKGSISDENTSLSLEVDLKSATTPTSEIKRTYRKKKNVSPINKIDNAVLNSATSLSEGKEKPPGSPCSFKDDLVSNVKKCPKLKISVSKSIQGSNKCRYVSERKVSSDSTPSDEITVLKPSERIGFNKVKKNRSKSFSSPAFSDLVDVTASTPDSNTFVINAVVHVDAYDSSDNDSREKGPKSEIQDTLDSIISTIKMDVNAEGQQLYLNYKAFITSLLSVAPTKMKQEPVEAPVEPPANDTVHAKLEKCNLKLNKGLKQIKSPEKRKSMPAVKKNTPIAALAAAVKKYSATKSKGSKKLETPLSTPISKPPDASRAVKSAPPKIRNKKFSVEEVTLPFSMGWMRELVHRSTEGKSGKKQSDIYYFTPEGGKLRSMVDISNYLSRHPECKLTVNNFTYAKELIYREPFEIERSAKQKSVLVATHELTPPIKKLKTSTPKITGFLKKTLTTPIATPKTSTLQSTTNKKPNAQISDIVCEADTSKNDISQSVSANKSSSKRQIKRKIPFDNSFDDAPTSKKTGIHTRRHSSAISVPEPEIEKSSELSVLGQTNCSTPSSTDAAPLTSSQSESIIATHLDSSKGKTLQKSSSSNKKKSTSSISKCVDVSYTARCSVRCMVPRYVLPSVQCKTCLCLFHPQCYSRSARNAIFQCKPCTVAKRAALALTRKPATFPFAIDDEEDISGCVETFLLYPEITLKMAIGSDFYPLTVPITLSSTVTTNSSIPKQTTDFAASSAMPYLHTSQNTAPQLLSHLLQNNMTPEPCTRASFSSQPISTPRPILPSTFRNPSNTIMYRVRLPSGGHSVTLPNSVVVRRLSEHKIMLCSTDPTQVRSKICVLPRSSRSPMPQLLPLPITQNEGRNVSLDKYGKVAISSNLAPFPPNVGSLSEQVMDDFSQHKVIDKSAGANNDKETLNVNGIIKSVECMTLVFKQLNIFDLLRATEVCRSWKSLGQHTSLWEKVSFRGVMVTDWQICCQYLQKRGTKHLDLCDIIHPDIFQPWEDLEINVSYLSKIEELIVDYLPPSLLKAIISNMPQLRRFECNFVTTACTEPEIWNTPCKIELAPFRCLGRLVRLKIGSGGGISLGSGSGFVMPYLPHLRHVALTGFDFHSHVNLEFISQLNDLISLELGNIYSIEPGIYPLLGTLTNLKSLRLENGGAIDEVKFSEALSEMKNLEVLELMNFKISANLASSLKKLKQLIHVNIWPDVTTETAAINENLLTALSSMKDLKYVCWGVIAEGDVSPDILQLRHTDSSGIERDELTFEDLFKKLVGLFSECRVEVKCVPRNMWREFCSTRK